jgi:hypothetical protein
MGDDVKIISLGWMMKHVNILDNGCWIWTGSKTQKGYGHIMTTSNPRKHYRAHRVMWELKKGQIQEGALVCHKCDNPACVNPDHLVLGTNKDNMDDKQRKGRGTPPPKMVGENHPQHKLTMRDVRLIRGEYKSGAPQVYIARKYGVTPQTINNIIRGRIWKNI